LSAKERHDLEKAALDDPFLADALDGYALPGINHAADLADLKNRLAGKMETGKVLIMKTGVKKSFPWMRAAVMVVIMAGAGFIAAQYLFKQNKKEIAQADIKKNEEVNASKTTEKTNATKPDSVSPVTGNFSNVKNQEEKPGTLPLQNNSNDGIVSNNANGKSNAATTEVTVAGKTTQPVETLRSKAEDEKGKAINAPAGITEKKDLAKEDVKSKTEIKNIQDADGDGIKVKLANEADEQQKIKSVAASRKAPENQNYRNQGYNTFSGRVTDANNVGLPFARVYNPDDNNAGTYTDVAGNFNLTFPDTVITVQVRSVGFENANVQLRNSEANNRVVLQDDKSLSEVVINTQKPNVAARSKESNKTLEEPEPADGWDNYDTYIANNLNAPEEIKTKPNGGGEVIVSFEVNKNGDPISLKIVKSLCDKCDKEAIRLIREGPKWKRNAKKGRTSVTVSFDHLL
ncbi:MAG: carboxypeptidase-like regulatory domain-containing protein, partial [Chitinophagaceae bacterium]